MSAASVVVCTVELLAERFEIGMCIFVDGDALLDAFAGVEDGCVVPAAKRLADRVK